MHSSVYSIRISRKVISYYVAIFSFCLLLGMSFIQEVQGKGKGKNKNEKVSQTLANFENDEYGNRRPGLGNIGCLFSKSVCDDLVEWCFDDYAFGRCLPKQGVVDEPSLYRYDLSKSDTHALEKEIERLFALGYRWRHSYTQCVLQNMLESQRRGSEWEQAVCSEEVDQDLEGALKAFADEIDPWNVAFVKFTPSKEDPHANFADEMYRPPGILPDPGVEIPANLIGHETTKEAKSNSLSRLRQPLLHLTPPEEKLLEDAIEDYLTEDNVPINSIPSWRNKKSGSPLLLRASGSGNIKRTAEDWEREVEQEAAEEAFLDQQVGGKQSINNFGVGPGGIVDESILEPRIFSSMYNTPDMFRQGVELKDELVGRNGLGDGDVEGDESMKSRTDDNDVQQGQEELLMLEQLALLAKDQEQQQELLTGGRDTGPELQLGLPLRQSLRSDLRDSPVVEEERRELEIPEFLPVPAAALGSLSASADPHYTEGGLVFLRNDDPPEFLFDGDDLGRSRSQPTNSQKKGFLKRIFLGEDDDGSEQQLRDEYQSPEAFELSYGYGFRGDGGEGSFNGPQRAFERRERLDVKKPGPYYRTVNNFAFDNNKDKTEKGNIELSLKEHVFQNPEFNEEEGPADMMTPPEKQLKDSQLPSQSLSEDVSQSNVNGNDEARQQGSEVGNQQHQPFRQAKDTNGEFSGFMDKKSAPVDFQKTIPYTKKDEHLLNIDTTYVAVTIDKQVSPDQAINLVNNWADALDIRRRYFGDVRVSADNIVTFKVGQNEKHWNSSKVASEIENLSENAKKYTGVSIVKTDVGIETNRKVPSVSLYEDRVDKNLFIATFALCGIVAAILVAALSLFLIRKHAKSKQKIARLADEDPSFEACKDYQDLCRARMAGSKNNEKVEPLKGAPQRVASTMSRDSENGTNSSRSSTSSWTEEPVLTNMDISTGHMVLSYMEDHLKKRDRLDQEWAALCNYEADPCSTAIAEKPEHSMKNRYSNSLPYDHSRVILNDLANINGSDYINASTITDHDPRNPAYIATQGPLATTAADFWQMVWEQGSVVIVTLTRLSDNGTALCHRYWPEEGSELHHIYEVHLVSEHIWCDEYLVRSFYLKNLKTGETRTVTQFHFQAWLENSIPQSTKAILEFRRKVNKSYRGRSCPIIVHCSDGAGRTGTYCLIDMVLNRMAKGAKEIDIAASLEHIRDQRPGMVRTKQQFEFVLMAVAEEVHAILKALPQ